MLHHISICAHQPAHVARVLAEILGGTMIPFPGHEGCYMALALDTHGTLIEVLPETMVFMPGSLGEEAQFVDIARAQGHSPTHAAISVALSPEEIYAIGRREGWRCERFSRGGGLFEVIELWIENRQMIELLPPALAQTYLNFWSPENLRRFLAEAAPQPVGATR